MNCRWILPTLFCIAAVAADRPAVPAKLTLHDAIDIAMRSSTALERADAQLQQAQAQAAQARSGLLPQANISANDTLQTVNLKAMGIETPFLPSRVGPFQSVDAHAYLSQNIFNSVVRERTRAGKEQVRAVSALRDNARELLALQVATLYAQAVRAQSAAATLAEQLDLSRKLDQITADRTAAGAASLLERKRSQQQVNNLVQTLEESRQQLTATKLQLANLIHAQVTAEYELAPEPVAFNAAPDRAAALAQAMVSRPDFLAAQSQVRAAERQVAAAHGERYPVLQFQADYGQSGRKPFENLNTFHVRGVFSIPVFTGGRIAAEESEARGKVKEAQGLLEELRSQVETDVLTALAAQESAARQVQAAAENVSLARDEVDLSTERFTSGVADNTEVVNAQDRLSRAADSRVRAEFALSIARAQVARAIGSAEKSYRGTTR